MTPIASAAAQAAATLPLFPPSPRPDTTSSLLQAATTLMEALARGQALDTHALRAAMEAAFGASDAAGAWDWKLAYEAGEAAQILFLRKFGPAMRARAGSPAVFLAMLGKLAALAPSQTRRSEESQALQQFSTPIALGFAAATAAAITSTDLVLEPSAGTGLLAIFAELAGARLSLNEFAETRGSSGRPINATLKRRNGPTQPVPTRLRSHPDMSRDIRIGFSIERTKPNSNVVRVVRHSRKHGRPAARTKAPSSAKRGLILGY